MMQRLRSIALLGALGGLTGLSGCVKQTTIPGTCQKNSAVTCGAERHPCRRQGRRRVGRGAGPGRLQLQRRGRRATGRTRRADGAAPRRRRQVHPGRALREDLRRHDRRAPGRSTATGDAGLLLHEGRGSGELRAEPKPDPGLSRGLRLPVLRPQPAGGEQSRGDVWQRPPGGRAPSTTAASMRPDQPAACRPRAPCPAWGA